MKYLKPNLICVSENSENACFNGSAAVGSSAPAIFCDTGSFPIGTTCFDGATNNYFYYMCAGGGANTPGTCNAGTQPANYCNTGGNVS